MTRRRLEVGDGERGRGGGGRGGGGSTIQLVLPTQCRIHIVYTHCLIFIAFNFFLYSMCQGRAAERKSGLAKLSQSRKHLCRKCIFHQSLLISRRVIVFPKESQQGKLFLCSHYGRHESPNTCKKKNTLYLLRRPTKLIEMCPVCNVVCTAANREMFCPNRTNPIDHFQSFCNARVTLKPKANQIIVELRFYRTHVHMGSDHWVALSVTTYVQDLFETL